MEIIDSSAFVGCGLLVVVIPRSVAFIIQSNAFALCVNLRVTDFGHNSQLRMIERGRCSSTCGFRWSGARHAGDVDLVRRVFHVSGRHADRI